MFVFQTLMATLLSRELLVLKTDCAGNITQSVVVSYLPIHR